MDFELCTLFEEINKVSKEIGNILRENDLTSTEDIQALCYEALSELFPGGGRKIIHRSKVWKIIQDSLNDETCSISSKTSSSSSQVSSPCPSPSPSDSSFKSRIECSPVIKSTSTPSSPQRVSCVESSNLKPSVLKGPEYMMYSDPAIQNAAAEGKLNKPMRERLIRGTINNMVSTSSSPPFNRFPKSAEIEEMAKSLVILYPCLRDDETDHGVVFKALKRRLSNTKPVVKPQGPTPNKRKYTNNVGKDPKGAQKVQKVHDDVTRGDSCVDEVSADEKVPDHDPVDGQEVMDRHYQGLIKELEKKNPNKDVVNSYLNKEFTARRDWLKNVPPAERVDELLRQYPCFKDHTEIIEEARRVLKIEQRRDRNHFKNECCELLLSEVETIIYYGINNKGLTTPKSPKSNSKILHVLQNLQNVFGPKKLTKKPVELVHQLKDHEDPEQWCGKRAGNVPVLIVDNSKCYLVVGKAIICEVEVTELCEAAVALLASFYLLDYDYPRLQEIGLSILQVYVFKDTQIPEDMSSAFKSALTSYRSFKNDI